MLIETYCHLDKPSRKHLNGKVFIDRVENTLDVVMEREYLRIVHGG